MENFLREMLLIFPILEVSAFQLSTAVDLSPETPSREGATEAVLHLTGPQTTATGTARRKASSSRQDREGD